ncbi:MAG: hypothetical protein IPL83_12390 [Bdellovibrionales bacterium]|nr:hypothetical protein [Bdellovibrionales bacterium]
MKAIILFTIPFLAICAKAHILTEDSKSFDVTATYGTAKAMWAGSDKADFAASGQTVNTSLSLTHSWGLGDGAQFDFKLVYTNLKMEEGSDPMSMVPTGSQRGGISEIGMRYNKSLWSNSNSELVGALGFREPGDGRDGNNFLAISDGQRKVDYSLNYYYITGPIELRLGHQLTTRQDASHKPFSITDLSASFFSDRESYALTYSSKVTTDGPDVMAGPFDTLKEDYTALALSMSRTYGANSAQIFVSQKITGRNTGATQALGLGYTVNY